MDANLFTGAFADNIRISPSNDKALRESMQEFGWIAEFPALVDENNLVLVGHRRLAIAKELNIEPVIKILSLGAGDDATAERLKLAIASNIGGAPLTVADRQHIAKHLYGIPRWTMALIGKALGVSDRTISEDLRKSGVDSKLKQAKTAKKRSSEVTSEPTKRKGAGKKNGTPGPKARLANGFSKISEAAAAGIKVEMDGGTADEALKASSLARGTYSAARDLVLLSERSDLSNKDMLLVKKALTQLDESNAVSASYELVKPIVKRLWGANGNRFTADKKRIESFFESIGGVTAGCIAISTELTIPYLGPDQQAEALDTLREARDALDTIIDRIKQGGLT